MSNKRKRPTSKKFREKHPREIGRFYKIHDSKGGHPARVYYADPTNDIYYVQRFSTKSRKGRVKLLHNIKPGSDKEQWLIKKPEAVGYDDISYEINYVNYQINPDDQSTIEQFQIFNLEKKKR